MIKDTQYFTGKEKNLRSYKYIYLDVYLYKITASSSHQLYFKLEKIYKKKRRKKEK